MDRCVVVEDYPAGFHFRFESHGDSPCVGAGLTSRRVVIPYQSAGFHFGFEFQIHPPFRTGLNTETVLSP
jgi:hypothetical protein